MGTASAERGGFSSTIYCDEVAATNRCTPAVESSPLSRADGLLKRTFTFSPPFSEVTTPDGRYYSVDHEVQASGGRPIQPRVSRDIAEAGVGALLYLPPDTATRSLLESVQAVEQARTEGKRTAAHARGPKGGTSTGMRHYGMGAQILRAAGLRQIRLLSNTPIKLSNITGFGLNIIEVVPIPQLAGMGSAED